LRKRSFLSLNRIFAVAKLDIFFELTIFFEKNNYFFLQISIFTPQYRHYWE